MSKYKNLILIGISLSVGFGLALTLGLSVEETSDLCHECDVKELFNQMVAAYAEVAGVNLLPLWMGFASVTVNRPCESCRHEQNKALVKEAILAWSEDPYYANLPEQFDPNYVQYGPHPYYPEHPQSRIYIDDDVSPSMLGELRIDSIIAEGDMVVIRLTWLDAYIEGAEMYTQICIFRICRNKIVEGHIASTTILCERD